MEKFGSRKVSVVMMESLNCASMDRGEVYANRDFLQKMPELHVKNLGCLKVSIIVLHCLNTKTECFVLFQRCCGTETHTVTCTSASN